MAGWLKLNRKLTNKAFYSKDSEKVHLWIHLLMKANFSDREEMLGGKPFICKMGQFTTGRKQLSAETGISESKIERILTYFEKIEQQIEQQKTSTNRLISILNWDSYQQSEQQSEQQVNNDRTTTEQQVNTLKEVKELKKEKNSIKKEIAEISSEIPSIPKIKKSLDDRKKEFTEKVGKFKDKYSSEILNSFFAYWTEKTHDEKKMKFELTQTFEIGKRLGTWNTNEKKFNQNNNQTNGKPRINKSDRIDKVAFLQDVAERLSGR